MSNDTRTIAFVLYPGLTPLDLVGPLQVMSGLEVVEAAFGCSPGTTSLWSLRTSIRSRLTLRST